MEDIFDQENDAVRVSCKQIYVRLYNRVNNSLTQEQEDRTADVIIANVAMLHYWRTMENANHGTVLNGVTELLQQMFDRHITEQDILTIILFGANQELRRGHWNTGIPAQNAIRTIVQDNIHMHEDNAIIGFNETVKMVASALPEILRSNGGIHPRDFFQYAMFRIKVPSYLQYVYDRLLGFICRKVRLDGVAVDQNQWILNDGLYAELKHILSRLKRVDEHGNKTFCQFVGRDNILQMIRFDANNLCLNFDKLCNEVFFKGYLHYYWNLARFSHIRMPKQCNKFQKYCKQFYVNMSSNPLKTNPLAIVGHLSAIVLGLKTEIASEWTINFIIKKLINDTDSTTKDRIVMLLTITDAQTHTRIDDLKARIRNLSDEDVKTLISNWRSNNSNILVKLRHLLGAEKVDRIIKDMHDKCKEIKGSVEGWSEFWCNSGRISAGYYAPSRWSIQFINGPLQDICIFALIYAKCNGYDDRWLSGLFNRLAEIINVRANDLDDHASRNTYGFPSFHNTYAFQLMNDSDFLKREQTKLEELRPEERKIVQQAEYNRDTNKIESAIQKCKDDCISENDILDLDDAQINIGNTERQAIEKLLAIHKSQMINITANNS